MEQSTEQINWYNDYIINESISGNVKDIIGTYSRLQSNFPTHQDCQKWKDEGKKWVDYKRTLPNLVINTEAEALALKEKIATQIKALDKFEDTLLQKKRNGITT